MSDMTFHVIIDQCGSRPNPPEQELARILSDEGYGGAVTRTDTASTPTASFEPGQCEAQHRPANAKQVRSIDFTSVADAKDVPSTRHDLVNTIVITFTDDSTLRVEAGFEETSYMIIPCLKIEEEE